MLPSPFDLFIKHFTEKPLNEELLKIKKSTEDNIESLSKELKELKDKGDNEGFNGLVHKFAMLDLYLSKEGLHLTDDIRNKIYSILAY